MEPIWIVSGSNELRCGVVEADAVEPSSDGAVAATSSLSMWSMPAISVLRVVSAGPGSGSPHWW